MYSFSAFWIKLSRSSSLPLADLEFYTFLPLTFIFIQKPQLASAYSGHPFFHCLQKVMKTTCFTHHSRAAIPHNLLCLTWNGLTCSDWLKQSILCPEAICDNEIWCVFIGKDGVNPITGQQHHDLMSCVTYGYAGIYCCFLVLCIDFYAIILPFFNAFWKQLSSALPPVSDLTLHYLTLYLHSHIELLVFGYFILEWLPNASLVSL